MLPAILFNKSSQLRISKNRGAVLNARHARCFWTHAILHYHHILSRSSLLEMFCIKIVLINFAKFTGKHLRQRLFNNKVTDLSPAALLKKILWHRGCPVNFVKFLRTAFVTEHLRRLLLAFRYGAKLDWERDTSGSMSDVKNNCENPPGIFFIIWSVMVQCR